MKKLILNLIFLNFCSNGICQQSDTALIYYDLGVKEFRLNNYKIADSLFTLSVNKTSHPDTYFSRAACRLKMDNKKGYCEDLCFAAVLGDKESDGLFRKNCGQVDTAFTDINNKPANRTNYNYEIILYKSQYENANIAVKYDKKGSFIESIRFNNKIDTIATTITESAEFPGGVPALIKFIKDNMRFPKEARDNGINAKCFLKFVILKTGAISDIEILQGIPGCEDCNREAVRIISSMPKWKPAKMGERKVNCYFNMPISFKSSGY